MTRIIAGSARGRVLAVPRRGTRPTSDRVRESMFSTIDAYLGRFGQEWGQIDALDLYAGTGALGLEALSRGANRVVLVEKDRAAASIIKGNIDTVGLPGAEIMIADATKLSGRLRNDPFDLVFVDPPYIVSAAVISEILGAGLCPAGLLEPEALVMVERPNGEGTSPFPTLWEVMQQRRHGDTMLWYGHLPGHERS